MSDTAEVKKIKREPRIQLDRFKVSDFSLGKFDARCEADTTRADLLLPEFWSHIAEGMTPYSEITARCDDDSFYAKLLVLSCGRGWANVKVLDWYDLNAKEVGQDMQSNLGSKDDFEVLHKGPNRKWIVQRKSDQVVLIEGESRRVGAEAWLDDYLKGNPKQSLAA